jgi:hypothetical protein
VTAVEQVDQVRIPAPAEIPPVLVVLGRTLVESSVYVDSVDLRSWQTEDIKPIWIRLMRHRDMSWSLSVHADNVVDGRRGTSEHTVWDATGPADAADAWLTSASVEAVRLCVLIINGLPKPESYDGTSMRVCGGALVALSEVA